MLKITGRSEWKDNFTGKTFSANKGDMLWLPNGSSSTLISSKDLSAFYVEATHRKSSKITKSQDVLTSISEDLRAQLIEQYVATNPCSQKVMEEASNFLPNSVTRTVLHYDPFPMVLKSGRECYVTSVDDREYLDFVSEFSAGMLGHSHPEIAKVVDSTMARGISLGGPSVEEGKLAALLTARLPSIEKIRFCNSGTEANTMALTVACAYKKKTKVDFCPLLHTLLHFIDKIIDFGVHEWLPWGISRFWEDTKSWHTAFGLRHGRIQQHRAVSDRYR